MSLKYCQYNYGRIILRHRITNCSMIVDISPIFFQARSPTPSSVDNSTWFLIVIYPVVLLAVVATFSGLLWRASDDGWKVTPRSAVGIPSAAILALVVTYLIFHGLEVPLYESALFWGPSRYYTGPVQSVGLLSSNVVGSTSPLLAW